MFDHTHFSGDDDQASRSPPAARTALSPLPSADPRRRIFDATIHTVACRGYDRTTLSRVLARAQLPEAVFAEHFHDKRDCFLQAVDELIGAAEQAALDEFRGPGPWHAHVHSALRMLLEGLARSQDAARVVFVEMLAAGPAAHERHGVATTLFASLIEQGSSHMPEADALPPQMSEAVVGGIASILHRRVLQGETATLPSLLGDITYFALLPYLAQEQAMSVADLPAAA